MNAAARAINSVFFILLFFEKLDVLDALDNLDNLERRIKIPKFDHRATSREVCQESCEDL